ncbi:MAG: TetR/AcrR family transcriptional regulator [Bacteroidales bacterium]|jgi:AcrR family transcriptional regulator
MSIQDQTTEKKILDAAKTVFLEKGFDGARMQEIADEAKINKALVHYYFRSKDKLFDAIFQEAFQQFLPKIAEIMMTEKPLFEKIEFFIDTYIFMLLKNPHLPGFVMHEINRNPDRIVNIIKGSGFKPEYLEKAIRKEVKAGLIIPIDPVHLIINILGMCLFPIIGRPIIKGFVFNDSDKAYNKFLSERKKEVTSFVINSIKKK